MAGPGLRKSDVERRIKIASAKAMLEVAAKTADSGDFDEKLVLILTAKAALKLVEVVEELDKGGE